MGAQCGGKCGATVPGMMAITGFIKRRRNAPVPEEVVPGASGALVQWS